MGGPKPLLAPPNGNLGGPVPLVSTGSGPHDSVRPAACGLRPAEKYCSEQKLLLPSGLELVSESSESGALSLSSAARHIDFHSLRRIYVVLVALSIALSLQYEPIKPTHSSSTFRAACGKL